VHHSAGWKMAVRQRSHQLLIRCQLAFQDDDRMRGTVVMVMTSQRNADVLLTLAGSLQGWIRAGGNDTQSACISCQRDWDAVVVRGADQALPNRRARIRIP
jgi:hypothetical protein